MELLLLVAVAVVAVAVLTVIDLHLKDKFLIDGPVVAVVVAVLDTL
jgi:hypothetical protein